MSSSSIGLYGEMVAESRLRAGKCSILRKNWKIGSAGELDVVCRDGDTLVFVEVKTRTSHSVWEAMRSVDKKKRELIRSGVHAWLRLLNDRDVPYRYDVMEIYLCEGEKPEIHWIRAAFGDCDSNV